MSVSRRSIAVFSVASSLLIGMASAAFAQSATSPNASSDTARGVAASAAKPTKAEQKAERKAARKAARAKKNAEIKQLEESGFRPGGNNPYYPQDFQKAQEKASAGKGASQ